MRRISGILGAVLLVALVAPASGGAAAVRLDMPIIDLQGNPVMGFTIVSDWGNGKVTQMTTDPFGRARGEVPEGWHFCSVWLEGLHIESGFCDFTTNVRPLFISQAPRGQRFARNGNGYHLYAPVRPRIVLVGREEDIQKLIDNGFTREAAEKLLGYTTGPTTVTTAGTPSTSTEAANEVPINIRQELYDAGVRRWLDNMSSRFGFWPFGPPSDRAVLITKWGEFGVLMADLFGLNENAGDSGGDGDGGD